MPAVGEDTPAAPTPRFGGIRARITDKQWWYGLLEQMSKYFGVSFTQTFVEFGVFAGLEAFGMPARIANVFALICSASYNFLMNRNVTFKASSNFARSVRRFVLLVCWNMLFSTTCLTFIPGALGISSTIVKMLTMCCQGLWGFWLCRTVIFK